MAIWCLLECDCVVTLRDGWINQRKTRSENTLNIDTFVKYISVRNNLGIFLLADFIIDTVVTTTNTIYLPSFVSILAHCLWHWPSIEPTLGERFAFFGKSILRNKIAIVFVIVICRVVQSSMRCCPSEHEPLHQCCFIAGPQSTTLVQL